MRIQNFKLPLNKNKESVLLFSGVSLENYREVLGKAPPGSRFAIPVFSDFSNKHKMIVFNSIAEFPKAYRKMKSIIKSSCPIPGFHLIEDAYVFAFIPVGGERNGV